MILTVNINHILYTLIRSMRQNVSIRLYVIGIVVFAFVFVLCVLYISYRKKSGALRVSQINAKQLGKKCREYSKTVDSLTAKSDYLEKNGSETSKVLHKKKMMLDKKDKQIAELKASMEILEKEKESYIKQIKEKQSVIDSVNEDNESLNSKIKDLGIQLSNSKVAYEDLSKEKESLTAELNKVQKTSEKLREQLKNKEDEYEQLKTKKQLKGNNPIERLLG